MKAQAELNARLTRLFEGHRDELAVPPDVAAAALRSLIFGAGRFELGLGPQPDTHADRRPRAQRRPRRED